jgi:hypothetical protein
MHKRSGESGRKGSVKDPGPSGGIVAEKPERVNFEDLQKKQLTELEA